jgi:membrane carboxypeptidase/penicillin-binding protein
LTEIPTPKPRSTTRRTPNASARARIARIMLLGTMIVVASGLGVLWATYRTLGADLPSLEALEDARPVGGTMVLSAQGDTLRTFYRERRVNVRLE